MVEDPYSRTIRRCHGRPQPLWLEGKPYCQGCGRTVRKHYKRYVNWGQEGWREVYLHTGPIFSTTAGC